jgi:hypothetical protein
MTLCTTHKIGFEVLTADIIKNAVFWITLAVLFKESPMFRRNISPSSSVLQSKPIRNEKKQEAN